MKVMAQNPQDLEDQASELYVRGLGGKPSVGRRLMDAHGDAFSYFLGLCLALVLAPIAEFLITGQSTLVRFFSGGSETLETPQMSQQSTGQAIQTLAQRAQANLDAQAAAALANPSVQAALKALQPKSALPQVKDPSSLGASSAGSANADQILKEAIAALSHPPTNASGSPTSVTAGVNGAAGAAGVSLQRNALVGGGAAFGAAGGSRSTGATLKGTPGQQNLSSGSTDAQAAKPKLTLRNGFESLWQGLMKPFGKAQASGSGAGSSGSGAAGGAGGAGAGTLTGAAMASMAAAQQVSQQAAQLQQMADGINTNFSGPWQRDPILAPLHANLVQAKSAAQAAASAMQSYAGQLQAQAGNLMADARAFAAFAQNPSDTPPSMTAQSVGPPPDISQYLKAIQDARANIQKMIQILQNVQQPNFSPGAKAAKNTSPDFDSSGGMQNAP